MAHECPECMQVCYCDLDDIEMEAPDDCSHECGPEPDEDYADEVAGS